MVNKDSRIKCSRLINLLNVMEESALYVLPQNKYQIGQNGTAGRHRRRIISRAATAVNPENENVFST